MLAPVGMRNPTHLHGWSEVDVPLVVSRFLGDDGLVLRGIELGSELPLGDPWFQKTRVGVYFGEVRTHEGHGAESELDHDDHHQHELELDGRVFGLRVFHRRMLDDFQTVKFGLSGFLAENEEGQQTRVGGFDAEYLWRENGRAVGGRVFRWRTEIYGRQVGTDDGEFNEIGAYSSAVYSANVQWDIGLRVDCLSGVNKLDLDERWRVSPSVTFFTDQTRRLHLRGQYNFDHSDVQGTDHTVWLQLALQLGSTAHVD